MNKNTQKTMAALEGSYSWHLKNVFRQGYFNAIYEKEVAALQEKFPNLRVEVDAEGVEIFPETREELMFGIQLFSGDFEKTVNDYCKDKIDYCKTLNAEHAPIHRIIFKSVTPPDSCKVIEVEELVPASVRKVKKLFCGDAAKQHEGVTLPQGDPEVI